MAGINRRQVVRGAAAAAAVTLGSPAVRAQNGLQVLRFVAEADLKVLDPIWTSAYITRNHGYLVYDTLFGTDEKHQIKPQMVDQTVVSADGMTYTVHFARRPSMARRKAGAVGGLRGVAETMGKEGPSRPTPYGAHSKDRGCQQQDVHARAC